MGPRDQGPKREQPKRRKPQDAPHDEVELSGEAADTGDMPPPGSPVVVLPPKSALPVAGGPYSSHGPALPPPERHIDLNG